MVVLDAGEAFFLGRGHDLAVDHQRRGRVVVVGGDTEDCCWFLAHHSVEFISRLLSSLARNPDCARRFGAGGTPSGVPLLAVILSEGASDRVEGPPELDPVSFSSFSGELLTPVGRRDAPSPASGRWPAIPGLGHQSLPPAGLGDPSLGLRRPDSPPYDPAQIVGPARAGPWPTFSQRKSGDSLRECVMAGELPQPTLRSRANCGSEVGWALAHLFAEEIGATACVNA